MKSYIVIPALLVGALCSCHHAKPGAAAKSDSRAPQLIAEVTFQVDAPEDHAGDPSPYVNLADPKKDLKRMRSPGEVVYAGTELVVVLDYPLSQEFRFPISSSSPNGFRRAELAGKVAEIYKKVYAEEAETSKVTVTPPDQRKGLINRNTTQGKYGIWGHDLEDLVLHTIEISKMPDGTIQAYLGIDS